MSFPSQESQSELNQFPNLTTMVHNVDQIPLAIYPDDLTQRSLNSQFHPDVEVETGSGAQDGDGSSSCILHPSDIEPWGIVSKYFDAQLSSVAQTEDWSLILIPKTDMPRPGGGNANKLPQQFDSSDQPLNSLVENLTADQRVNSHGDVKTGVRCSEPNQSHLNHEERPSDQASNGQKKRGRKPRVTPVEKAKNQLDQAGTSAKARNGQKRKFRKPIIRTEEQENERKKKKIESDRNYWRGKKNELTELKKIEQAWKKIEAIVSEFGRIDQMGSQINRMSSELQKGQQEKVGNYMSQKVIIDFADRVPMTGANEVQLTVATSMYKEMEGEYHKLQLMKYKYGGIEEIESMLDKFENLQAKSQRFEQIKLLFSGVDEIEPQINRLKNIERQLDKCEQMETRMEMDSFQASPGTLQQLEVDRLCRQQKVADLDRFEQMKTMYSATKKMEFMLDKFPRMEAALQRFEQAKSDSRGIYEIKAGTYGLKKFESQRDKQKEPQFFTESPGRLQEQRGMHLLDLNSDSDMVWLLH